jgi:magnesium chelatase subunit H
MPSIDKRAHGETVTMVIVTMDTHLSSATAMAARRLAKQHPGLVLEMHAASEFSASAEALVSAQAAIARANILVVSMLFLEDHFKPILADLQEARDRVDAMLCIMSAAEVVKLTRLDRFDMGKPSSGLVSLLKRLRGKSGGSEGGESGRSATNTGGAAQMRMLRRLPKILRFIPGTAQDVRVYFLTLQYWLGGSEDNMVALARCLVSRYAKGPRSGWQGFASFQEPVLYPETGLYHPDLSGRLTEHLDQLPGVSGRARTSAGPRVGLLLLRSYLLAGNTAHYDGVIRALQAQGLVPVPAFAVGLDARPAVEAFFKKDGRSTVDAVVSLTGFSLVGGPAYNDAQAAEELLAGLDVPYIAAHPLEFQTLADWGDSDRGLMPVESTIMVAIPELDGAVSPMVYGGRPGAAGQVCHGCHRACRFDGLDNTLDMVSCPDRAEQLAHRVKRLVALRTDPIESQNLALVIFNFPPNGGSVGTAAHLSVFESMVHTLRALKAEGYDVQDLPADADALRQALLEGNRHRHGTEANVLAELPVAEYIASEPHLQEIEAAWGPAPGRQLTNGRSFFVQGLSFGRVKLLVQPGFGYEGDPMRLLFEKGMAPTHAFSAFYRFIREDLQAHAMVHFGTHGAMEFMPGKQTGSSGTCWPDRLIQQTPNFYLYAVNNPSEGTIAKRRSAATLLSYLTPSVCEAGLYKGLADLRQSLDRWRSMPLQVKGRLDLASEVGGVASVVVEQARALELSVAVDLEQDQVGQVDQAFQTLRQSLDEIEGTLIPQGLHVFGQPMPLGEQREVLSAMIKACQLQLPEQAIPEILSILVESQTQDKAKATLKKLVSADVAESDALATLMRVAFGLRENHEMESLLKALRGEFILPSVGGDLFRAPEILPTGRNLHGFDPFRMPSRFAWLDGQRQVERLLARHLEASGQLPESVAMVLWGTDNLKTEGGPIAQAMALMGARPRFDGFGRLAGAELIPLSELGRPRIDVVVTLSGIFRDLLPLQIRMLAEAALLAAQADEPLDQNAIRRHAQKTMAEQGVDLETAALRVFGNADGAYGANVNHLVDQGCWQNEDELADCYARRKGFAYGRSGQPVRQPQVLEAALSHVDFAYQNLESLEVGITSIDNYFDTLGGVSRLIRKAKGSNAETPVYIGDQTAGPGVVRTLSEQVALEARTRVLNPKWYEAVLSHGYEGVRQIEAHLTNTMGWSATTGQVQPWVYQQLTQTFLMDQTMRDRLADLNPNASAKLTGRLLEASDRQYWTPDPQTLQALREANDLFEDRIEGLYQGAST